MYSAQYQTCCDVHKTNSGTDDSPCHEDAMACSLLNSYDRGEECVKHKHRSVVEDTQDKSPSNCGSIDKVMDYMLCCMLVYAEDVQRTNDNICDYHDTIERDQE